MLFEVANQVRLFLQDVVKVVVVPGNQSKVSVSLQFWHSTTLRCHHPWQPKWIWTNLNLGLLVGIVWVSFCGEAQGSDPRWDWRETVWPRETVWRVDTSLREWPIELGCRESLYPTTARQHRYPTPTQNRYCSHRSSTHNWPPVPFCKQELWSKHIKPTFGFLSVCPPKQWLRLERKPNNRLDEFWPTSTLHQPKGRAHPYPSRDIAPIMSRGGPSPARRGGGLAQVEVEVEVEVGGPARRTTRTGLQKAVLTSLRSAKKCHVLYRKPTSTW